MQNRTVLRLALFIGFFVLTDLLAASPPSNGRFLIPKEAADVVEGPNPNGRQLTFKVTRKYPSVGLRQDWQTKAEAAGWTICSGLKPDGNLGRWNVHADPSRGKLQGLVHGYSALLVRDKEAIVVDARYYSKLDPSAGIGPSIPPGNNVQHVALIMLAGNEEAIGSLAQMYDATCQK